MYWHALSIRLLQPSNGGVVLELQYVLGGERGEIFIVLLGIKFVWDRNKKIWHMYRDVRRAS